jgi:hypothetical protein
VPWLRRLVADLPQRRIVFEPGSVHVGFVVDKVALGQVFLWVLRFSSVSIIIQPGLHTHTSSSGGRTIAPLVAAVRRHSLTPSTKEKLDPCVVEVLCLLCYTDWNFKYYLDNILLRGIKHTAEIQNLTLNKHLKRQETYTKYRLRFKWIWRYWQY